jgi:hypothetical protein
VKYTKKTSMELPEDSEGSCGHVSNCRDDHQQMAFRYHRECNLDCIITNKNTKHREHDDKIHGFWGCPLTILINCVARESFAHADGEKHHGQLIFINS